MYNRNNQRSSRPNGGGWKKRGSSGSSRFKKRRFGGDSINVERFINKAQPQNQEDAFKPSFLFDDLKIHQILKKAIVAKGFETPTPIQDKAIPAVLSGADVIGLANTGTGKTAAFLIPLVNKILNNPKEKVLVIVPIRELAIQIQEEFRLLTRGMNLASVVVVGGANMQRQIRDLRARHNLVIATPGRLKDLINRRALNLSGFSSVVLDEADRMLDMGFIGEIRLFLSQLAKERQTLLFSATLPMEIEKLAQEFLKNPMRISIKTRETSAQVDQNIVRITASQDKIEVLHDLLIQTHFEKVLVFTRTKYGADKLSKKLYEKGLKSDSIHGDKPHHKRQKVLQMFKQSTIDVLVATDVAARGLDIPNVSHVINFDLPASYEDYVHRIGRTGRADKQGSALTFVS